MVPKPIRDADWQRWANAIAKTLAAIAAIWTVWAKIPPDHQASSSVSAPRLIRKNPSNANPSNANPSNANPNSANPNSANLSNANLSNANPNNTNPSNANSLHKSLDKSPQADRLSIVDYLGPQVAPHLRIYINWLYAMPSGFAGDSYLSITHLLPSRIQRNY